MLEVKVRQPKCTFCPYYHRHAEAYGKKLKGVYLRPTSRYCTGGKRPKVFKTRDPKERIPAWCPRRLSPCIVRVYHYKNPETVFLQNLLHPSGSVPVISATNYAVCYETRVDITAAEFQKEISILNLSERLAFHCTTMKYWNLTMACIPTSSTWMMNCASIAFIFARRIAAGTP